MVFTTIGQSGLQSAIASISSNRPQYMAIGSGSGAVLSTDYKLVHEVAKRTFTSVDTSTANEILYTTDWNNTEVSGLTIRELGLVTESGNNVGSLWNREGFIGVDFDGTDDLQVQLTYIIT
jgi:phage-related tail fiber protein